MSQKINNKSSLSLLSILRREIPYTCLTLILIMISLHYLPLFKDHIDKYSDYYSLNKDSNLHKISFITKAFLHADLSHLYGNVFSLLLSGGGVEYLLKKRYGNGRGIFCFICYFFLSSWIISQQYYNLVFKETPSDFFSIPVVKKPNTSAIGASGVISCLSTFYLVLLAKERIEKMSRSEILLHKIRVSFIILGLVAELAVTVAKQQYYREAYYSNIEPKLVSIELERINHLVHCLGFLDGLSILPLINSLFSLSNKKGS